MKKILKGKRYDTDTAKLLGEYSAHPGSFDYISEELYRKQTGEYFLYGEGGARSKYAEHVEQSTWGPGEAIIPLTPEAAMQWAEEHLTADEYEAIFGPVPEDDSEVMLSVRVPASLKESLDRAKSTTGRTSAEIVAEALREYLKERR